jgi:hypothetical protein
MQPRWSYESLHRLLGSAPPDGANVGCFNLRDKNENYENLRGCKAPFILRSGAVISDARSFIGSF